MAYLFDTPVDRRGTDSYKWDPAPGAPKKKDMIPMWVADMDFACPPQITQALSRRTAHGIYGYTRRSPAHVASILNWIDSRYRWPVKETWLAFSPAGVIPAIYAMIQIKTAPGDSIIFQTPGYGPLQEVVLKSGRQVIENPLILEKYRYTIDFDRLKQQITPNTRMMIFCSPHNPTGRVWDRTELAELGRICLENKIFVVSDDVHSDMVYSGNTYLPMGSLSEELAPLTATCYSPCKTFNLGGLPTSTLVIPDPQTHAAYEGLMEMFQMRLDNLFSAVALEAGYTHGHQWLSELIAYLEANRDHLTDHIRSQMPPIRLHRPQGTFLAWLDLNPLGLSPARIRTLMLEMAGVIPSFGEEYGETGRGFIRLNFACPRQTLDRALSRISQALGQI